MNPASVLALSLSMSVDAFAVAVGRGTSLYRPRFAEALRTGIVFGIVEATTPFVGWLFGIAANDWVADFDHWLAFGLLTIVGLHMIYSALMPGDKAQGEGAQKTSIIVLMATALGTSIDAMAVGLSLALIDVDMPGILALSFGVGLTTCLLATGGMLLGKFVGERFGKYAEMLAGIVLCGIGGTILYEHLIG